MWKQVPADLFFVEPRNEPGTAKVAERHRPKPLSELCALPPPSSGPTPVFRWVRGEESVKVLGAMEVTCTEAEVCEYLLLAPAFSHTLKRLSKVCP